MTMKMVMRFEDKLGCSKCVKALLLGSGVCIRAVIRSGRISGGIISPNARDLSHHLYETAK